MQRELRPQRDRTRPSRRMRAAVFAVAGVLSIGAAACGDDDDDDGSDDTVLVPTVPGAGSLPAQTTPGSGPLDTYEVDTTGDATDGTVLGDPMEPTPNSMQVPDLTGPDQGP